MPSVIISKDSQLVSVSPLKAKTNIGRSLNNHIVLDAAGISRIHARIEQQQNRFLLIDESSTNGTYISGQRIERHLLTNGTSFCIVNYLLTFVDDLSPHKPPNPGLNTVTMLDNPPRNMLETLWLPHPPPHKTSLQQKVLRLLKMSNDLITEPNETEHGAIVLEALVDLTGAQRGVAAVMHKQREPLIAHVRGFDIKEQGIAISRSIIRTVIEKGTCILRNSADREHPTDSICEIGIKSILCVPIKNNEQTIGCIYLDHPNDAGVFSVTDKDLLMAAVEHVAEVFFPDKPEANQLAQKDKLFFEALKHQGIIARHPKTLKVFRDSKTIAPYDVSVLIFGETGTGKEIISRYIHNQSGRKGKFIARNCSAISTSIFESELFGHEKGAFTGATEQKRGILELADKGTLFLDEIGDMPAELQAKMLRAIQEQEVWRVGGSAPIKIDVRIIAATHQDIKTRRKKLNFRSDLYYRLANVEITAPSLRERPEDIAPLCDIILETFYQKHFKHKKKQHLSSKTLRLLEAYDWPGNIRELRNTLIQISLKCEGTTLEPRHLKEIIDVYTVHSKQSESIASLLEIERSHIIKALTLTNWNKSAAAKLLAIDRNRLNRRIKKLSIDTIKT